MKHYKEMVDFMRECRRLCPWNSRQTLQSYRKQLLNEAREVSAAVRKKDYQNLKEELGDVIWDAMMMAHIAEEDGHFRASEVVRDVTKKIKARKPYILEGRKVTLREAWATWHEAKAREKLLRK